MKQMSRFKEVLKLIGRHQKFLVSTHHNPDADALSSALSMALYLKSRAKKVVVLNEDACPDWLQFLPSTSLLKKAADVKAVDYEVAIILDCGDLKRIGGVKNLLVQGKPIVNIDHHITNDRFGTINVVDAKASSTCEMIFSFLKETKTKLNKSYADLLYAGIMTDTGSFRFENTSAHTHEVISQLLPFGISAVDMYQRLYVGMPVADMKIFSEVISQAKLLDHNRVFCVSLAKKVLSRFSKSFDLKEKLFTFLRSVDGIEVVVILTELGSKEIRINLRSQNDFDVASLAQQFDGGGHKKAAGCKIYDSLERAQKIICLAIHRKLGI